MIRILSVDAPGENAVTVVVQVDMPRPHTHLERERRIAEAAYYRAEKRGFAVGYALEDWLAAEALVDFELGRAGVGR